jgi:hypothetical protein
MSRLQRRIQAWLALEDLLTRPEVGSPWSRYGLN